MFICDAMSATCMQYSSFNCPEWGCEYIYGIVLIGGEKAMPRNPRKQIPGLGRYFYVNHDDLYPHHALPPTYIMH